MNFEKVEEIILKYSENNGDKIPALIPILQDIQDEYGWLPEQAFVKTSQLLDIPLVNLYGVATFYNEFRLKPIGKYHISVCMGTACHVQGAPDILAEIERKLGITAGDITPDEMFSLETASCFGCCAVAPVIMINEEYQGKMTKKKVSSLLEDLQEKGVEELEQKNYN
ncbi:MAG: NADH-quinone oxidoreductase subunit NuoE [Halanaerobiaceae bacterium]